MHVAGFLLPMSEKKTGNMHVIDTVQLTNSEVLDHVAKHHLCDRIGL
jgi:hypothetical protein